MSVWSEGYVVDVGYTHGYYPELNPVRTRFALLNSGYECPAMETACELGFGQGVSANIHAAAGHTEWWGTDFNPTHAAQAQQMAKASGSGARWLDDAFAAFAQRSDLPDFDFIALHGVWSWVSDNNRAVLVDFVRRKLKVGGVLYVGYNTLPGWNTMVPLRHLLTEHAHTMGAPGVGRETRIEQALSFVDQLLDTQPAHTQNHPELATRLQTLRGQKRGYLAHEYFNQDWQPMHFAQVAGCLAPAKVQYACSAHLLEQVDTFNLTPAQRAFLYGIPDTNLRETARDFVVNQAFRRDYWVKGGLRLSPREQSERLRAQGLLLVTPSKAVPLTVRGHLGEGQLDAAVYTPVLDLLADHQPHTLGQLEQAVAPLGISAEQLLQAVVVLCGLGHVAPVQNTTGSAAGCCDRLNGYAIGQTMGGQGFGHLASPATGGGVALSPAEQLFLLAIDQGHPTPAGWAQVAATFLADPTGLVAQAQAFADKLPALRALGVAPHATSAA